MQDIRPGHVTCFNSKYINMYGKEIFRFVIKLDPLKMMGFTRKEK